MASKKKTEKPSTSSITKPGDATASKAQAKQEDATVTCPVCAYQFKPGDPRL